MTDEIEKGSMLFQEKEDCVVLWADDLIYEDKGKVYLEICKEFKTTIVFPFVESKEEMNLLLEIGAVKIEFEDEDADDYCKEFGSFALIYGDKYGV